jgi:hypothetical protein
MAVTGNLLLPLEGVLDSSVVSVGSRVGDFRFSLNTRFLSSSLSIFSITCRER